jgi:hypothetical protein
MPKLLNCLKGASNPTLWGKYARLTGRTGHEGVKYNTKEKIPYNRLLRQHQLIEKI